MKLICSGVDIERKETMATATAAASLPSSLTLTTVLWATLLTWASVPSNILDKSAFGPNMSVMPIAFSAEFKVRDDPVSNLGICTKTLPILLSLLSKVS